MDKPCVTRLRLEQSCVTRLRSGIGPFFCYKDVGSDVDVCIRKGRSFNEVAGLQDNKKLRNIIYESKKLEKIVKNVTFWIELE